MKTETADIPTGHFLVCNLDGGNRRVIDPVHISNNIPAEKWVSKYDKADYKALPKLRIGQIARIMREYHPKKGFKCETFIRIA